MELKKRITEHLLKIKVSCQDIRKDSTLNPYPCGRENLERIIGGREVSEKIRVDLIDYFMELKQSK